MADPLYELLAPHLDVNPSAAPTLSPLSSTVTNYLSRITTLSLADLSSTEPQSLAQSSNSNLLSIQALSSRSHRAVVATANALSNLSECFPTLTSSASSLRDSIPELDAEAVGFSQKYSKSNTENEVLDRRKKALLLSRNVDRVFDILELPTLLTSAIASSSSQGGASGSTISAANYSQALDLFAHIKRLQILHPDSALIQSVLVEAEKAMKDMTSNLIYSLRGQNIRLAAAIRTIGWLRRVAPELAAPGLQSSSSKPSPGTTNALPTSSTSITSEGTFGYLFLTCRLYNLLNMLEALAPLRDLADQETQQRLERQKSTTQRPPSDQNNTPKKPSTYGHMPFAGQQTERYLKRYIEIFREQSFATVSTYKNIFPSTTDNPTNNALSMPPSHHHTKQINISKRISSPSSPLLPPSSSSAQFLHPPSPLSTFPSHLISLLSETLQIYLPNLIDQSARDSLLMQVLYTAGSLGRLGADFSLVIATLFEDDDDDNHLNRNVNPNLNEKEKEIKNGSRHENIDTSAIVLTEEDVGDENQARKPSQIDIGARPTRSEQNSPKDQHQPQPQNQGAEQQSKPPPIPDWIRIMAKHRLQSSRLEALSSSAGAEQKKK